MGLAHNTILATIVTDDKHSRITTQMTLSRGKAHPCFFQLFTKRINLLELFLPHSDDSQKI